GMAILVFLWRIMQRHQRRLDDANETIMNRLRAEAITDPLTSLGNHRSFQEGLGAAIRLGMRDDTPLTLARLDLDEFKVINERGGHLHGDSVLSGVGHLLNMIFPGRAYRVGGDEFALLLQIPADHVMAALDDLRTALTAGTLPTVSVGLTTTTSGTISPDDLHQQADQALREAKRRGRNRVVNFKDIAGRASLLCQAQVNALRDVLGGGPMDVAFQPIWGPARPGRAPGVPLAFEALARPAAESGFRGPQELFDVAARVNRSAELDRKCIRTALAHARSLPEGALLFLNLSPQTLDQDTPLAEQLLHDTEAAGLLPHRVVIEITERSTGNLPAVIQQAAALRAAGFRLALDDVGAGNSGLEMLRCLPVDFVKIDRSVVAAAPTDSTSNAVLAAIMAYARESGVTVIVEGIETMEILRHAWNLGARCAQGYLLGRPGPSFGTTFPAELERLAAHATAEGMGIPQRVQQ
uniref:bifunctional diguanylate cyclase/phosphodiesterase n=1 Tax=Deinococcus sp. TaxID=47478 RepID=UPI002869B9A5